MTVKVGLTASAQQLLRIKAGKSKTMSPQLRRALSRAVSKRRHFFFTHIFWDYPSAATRWDAIIRRWTAAGVRFGSTSATDIFGLNLRGFPSKTVDYVSKHSRSNILEALDAVPGLAKILWHCECAATTAVIWHQAMAPRLLRLK